jgi:hypothetical protein
MRILYSLALMFIAYASTTPALATGFVYEYEEEPAEASPIPELSSFNPHFSPGSRKQAQDSCSKAPLWSEKHSHSYGLSEEQAYGHEV